MVKKKNSSSKVKKHLFNFSKVIVVILVLILMAFIFNVIQLWIFPIIVILFLVILSFYHFYSTERHKWQKTLPYQKKKTDYTKLKELHHKKVFLKTLQILITITIIITLIILYQYIQMWIVPIIAFIFLLGVLKHHFYPK